MEFIPTIELARLLMRHASTVSRYLARRYAAGEPRIRRINAGRGYFLVREDLAREIIAEFKTRRAGAPRGNHNWRGCGNTP